MNYYEFFEVWNVSLAKNIWFWCWCRSWSRFRNFVIRFFTVEGWRHSNP